MEKMMKTVAELERRVSGTPARIVAASPFSRAITDMVMPRGMRVHVGPAFAGTTDPADHLNNFRNYAVLHGYPDAIKCKVFATTFTGGALAWFNMLPENSISTWEEFSTIFLTQFVFGKKLERDPISLFNVRQGDNESLRDYVKKFNAATLETPAAAAGMKIGAFTHGLKVGGLFRSLTKRPPASYGELLYKAECHINLEEAEAAKGPGPVAARRHEDNRSKNQNGGRKWSPGQIPQAGRIPLRGNWTDHLMAVEDKPYVRWPEGSEKGPRNPPSGIYCKYHREFGHETDTCQELINEIQRLAQEGYLKEFVINIRNNNRGSGGWRRGAGRYQGRGNGRNNSYRNNQGGNRQMEALPPPPPGPVPDDADRRTVHIISGGQDVSKREIRRQIRELEGTMERVMKLSEDPQPAARAVPDVQFRPAGEKEKAFNKYYDAIVIDGVMANIDMRRIFVDSGSSVDVIFYEAFQKMEIGDDKLDPPNASLIGFSGACIRPKGRISLPVTIGVGRQSSTKWVQFTIVDVPSSYNAILGRPSLVLFDALISIAQMCILFPTNAGVGKAFSSPALARKCFIASLGSEEGLTASSDQTKIQEDKKRKPDDEMEEGKEIGLVPPKHVKPSGEVMSIELYPGDPTKTVKIGSQLGPEEREELTAVLREHADVFSWTADDLVGIDPQVIEHRLNVYPQARPIIQKKRHHGTERDAIIQAEVDKLLKARHIREIQFPEWVSNVVLVEKKDKKWRMCIDFRNLNNACPKDHYPLPRIDQLVDATAGYDILSTMDAQSGYHQIPLSKEDQKRVSFITSSGTYCYVVMPFGLKNAGATYQRLVDFMFKDQVGKNLEVYVDDMVVKSKGTKQHWADLRQTFATLQRFHMKLNPAKCAFGVAGGKF